MLPARSNTWPGSMPRNQSRVFHPIGVGSSAGSSVAVGQRPPLFVELAGRARARGDSGLAVQVDLLDREAREGSAGGGLVPPGPPLQVLGRRRAEAGQPAAGEIALRLCRVDRWQALRPPLRDRLPAVVTAGPGPGRGAADERPSALMRVRRDVVTFCGRSDGARARMRVRSAGSSSASCAPVAVPRAARALLGAVLQAGQPAAARPRDGGLAAVALQLADQPSTEHRGQRRADRGLHGRDVLAREDEQCATHRHPPHQAAPLIHRVGHIGQRRCGAAREHGQVDRCRVAWHATRSALASPPRDCRHRLPRWWRRTIARRRCCTVIARTVTPFPSSPGMPAICML